MDRLSQHRLRRALAQNTARAASRLRPPLPVVVSEAVPPGTVVLISPAREFETAEEHAARCAVLRNIVAE